MLSDYYYSGLLNHVNRLKSVLIIVFLMSVAAIVLVPLLAEPVIRFFFSAKYVEVAPVLIWFILNSIIAGLSWILSQNMLLQGKQILLATRQVISLVIFVGCLIISIVYYFKYPVKLSKAE